MNRILLIAWLSAITLLIGSCRRGDADRYLVISEAVRFELQPGTGNLNLPMFAGTMGSEKIVRDVSQAEYYYQKLASVYGPKSFRFLADSTVELLLEYSGPLHVPQLVYGFEDGNSHIELSLVSFESNTAHYAFRVSDKQSGQVRDHAVEVPAGQSASIGMLFDAEKNRGQLVCIAVQALTVRKDLTPSQLAEFLREKNTPRGVASLSGFRPDDQRWMDDIFGPRGLRLPIDSGSSGNPERQPKQDSPAASADSSKIEKFMRFDVPPSPVGGMAGLVAKFKYPETAKRDSVTGRVILKVGIDERGMVRTCEIVRGVRSDLDSAAVVAVRSAEFTPAMYQGKPVATSVVIPIAFKLQP